ncbi:VOC family protein [Streptomyces spongiae]|uniref:2,3-dihydroxybiphenyl 1,2-dioxygenase n=1 Tax=Streptomyces spongiae TaxID=565072 RepID=A0A5N8XTR2_9ACTN|nr:VOC family protein [Streptomyces spongiae]MPY62777.1 2,3-dihydroxybiphenyl 1,2-dioxygenase [Streptomyces spongiae]
MSVRSLGYLGIGTPDPDGWVAYAHDVIGAMSVGPPGSAEERLLRLDEHPYRFSVEAAETGGVTYIGWEVGDPAGLERLTARLRAHGVEVHEAAPEECAARQVDRMVWFDGPCSVRTELFTGRRVAATPFVSPLGVTFVTGDQGMGHVVLMSPRAMEAVDFYRDVLGFRLSDVTHLPMGGTFYFMGCNPRHHSVAFVASRKREGTHHILCEVSSADEVGRAHDRAREHKVPLMATLGRHSNDLMFSFYMRSPAGFGIEVGAEGRRVDDETWVSRVYTADVWGHHAVADGDDGYAGTVGTIGTTSTERTATR